MPGGAVLVGMLSLEQRLGLAVASLLAQVAAHGAAAVVADDRAGAERDLPARVEQPPAHVDVVAGGAELRVEAAEPLQRVLADRHVAAGDVLGLAVGDQHVRRVRPGRWRRIARRGPSRAAGHSARPTPT